MQVQGNVANRLNLEGRMAMMVGRRRVVRRAEFVAGVDEAELVRAAEADDAAVRQQRRLEDALAVDVRLRLRAARRHRHDALRVRHDAVTRVDPRTEQLDARACAKTTNELPL